MNRKWMPITAGILDIIYGGFGVLFGPYAIFIETVFRFPQAEWYQITGPMVFIAGLFSIIGGIHHIKIKKWSLALTGSICMLFITGMFIVDLYVIPIALRSIPGIFAIVVLVLTILSRKQFER